MLGPQKERNINARTGSSADATVPLASSAPSVDDDGEDDAVAEPLVPRQRQPTRLIACLRLMATLHTELATADVKEGEEIEQGGRRRSRRGAARALYIQTTERASEREKGRRGQLGRPRPAVFASSGVPGQLQLTVSAALPPFLAGRKKLRATRSVVQGLKVKRRAASSIESIMRCSFPTVFQQI